MFGQLTDRAVTALSEKLEAITKSSKVSYSNGDKYEGQTEGPQQNLRQGFGIYSYADGKGRYEGEFVDDEKHGRGGYFFDEGDAYVGQWCSNQQHGRGVSVHWSPAEGVWVYKGDFRNGRRHGSGILHARDTGALCGSWVGGSLARGVELRTESGEGTLRVSVHGSPPEEEAGEVSPGGTPAASPERQRELGLAPRDWTPQEVRLWLWGLGLEESPDRHSAPLQGATLFTCTDAQELIGNRQITAGMSDLAQSWRATLQDAHTLLCKAVDDAQVPLRSWEDFQSAVPSIRKRFIPPDQIAIDRATDGRALQSGEWSGMGGVELLPLPLRLETSRWASASGGLPMTTALAWARDLEALATLRHPNLRPLLGISMGAENGVSAGEARLVYEASKGGVTPLFEWIHASLPDGSRRPLDIRSELKIGMGVCEALCMLSARGIVFAALCSVNVELVRGADGGLVARLARLGSCWWRWGWRASLQRREAGKAKRQALTVDEVVKRYCSCPINWQAPEVLRGEEPTLSADVYSFGLLLWEMLYRAVPYGDYSIAQIICMVGHGRRELNSAASPGASTETSYLHEVVARCSQRDPNVRPSAAVLLTSLRDVAKGYEQRKAQRSMLGKLGDKTESFLASSLMSGSLQRSLYGSDVGKSSKSKSKAAAAIGEVGEDEQRRMVCLASGEWVRVNADLVEQFPGDEEKWRTLMTFRSQLPAGGE